MKCGLDVKALLGDSNEAEEEFVPEPKVYSQARPGVTNVTFYITWEMRDALQRCALDMNTSGQQLLNEACAWLWNKYGIGKFVPVPTQKRGRKPMKK